MRIPKGLLLLLLPTVPLVSANTEKTIFLAPDSIPFPNVHPGLDDLCIDKLTPHSSVLQNQLHVAFPNSTSPKGPQSWYLLDNLQAGQRYEVRICWAAIQPTEFWLDTYSISEVFETPDLITGLAAYSETRPQSACPKEQNLDPSAQGTKSSTLFLRIHSAADFYTTNKTLMSSPPLVEVDIILDPFLLNVFPKSLLPTAAYITLIALVSWPLAGMVWTWLRSLAHGVDGKTHGD